MPRNLSAGSQGLDVRNLQQLLNLHHNDTDKVIAVDGIFGPETDARVRSFQIYCGLVDANGRPDGIVGPNTRAALLPERDFTLQALLQPGGGDVVAASGPPFVSLARGIGPFGSTPSFALISHLRNLQSATGALAAPTFQPVSDPTPPPQPVHRQFQVLAGQQVNLFPFSLQPWVITAQFNWIVKNPGKPDFVLTLGGQFSLNQTGGPNGAWTGQGFAQMGVALNKKVGDLDLLNPFVVTMLQRNQGQPFTWSTGIGNQTNYNLDTSGKWSLFLNNQAVVNVDLTTGLCSAPGLQILGGVAFTIDPL